MAQKRGVEKMDLVPTLYLSFLNIVSIRKKTCKLLDYIVDIELLWASMYHKNCIYNKLLYTQKLKDL